MYRVEVFVLGVHNLEIGGEEADKGTRTLRRG
jgi:hypothetical protein